MSDPNGPQSLGQIDINTVAFELDIKISDRYQAFSTELLRLCLASVTAVGFFAQYLDLKNSGAPVKSLISGSLVALGIGTAAALAHRYFGPDSLAYHLSFLRLIKRDRPGDKDAAKEERRGRDLRLKLSAHLLLSASIAFGIGAALLVAAFLGLIWG